MQPSYIPSDNGRCWSLLYCGLRETVEEDKDDSDEDDDDEMVDETEPLRFCGERGIGRWQNSPRRVQSPQTGSTSSHFFRLVYLSDLAVQTNCIDFYRCLQVMHPERVRCTRLTRHVVVGLVVDKSNELMSKESTESTGGGGSCSSLMSDSVDCCGIEMSVVTGGFFLGLPIGYPLTLE